MKACEIIHSEREKETRIIKKMLHKKRTDIESLRPQASSRFYKEEPVRRFERDSSNSSYRKLISRNNNADQLESDDTQDQLEDHWRETAQIFTDNDGYNLFEDSRSKMFNHQRRQQVLKPTRSQQTSSSKKFLSHRQQGHLPVYLENARGTPESGQSRDTNSADNEADDDDDDDDDQRAEEDDDSSISFAQSGCHSILSAWRIKAANRAARRLTRNNQSNSHRPTSVLSNGSSAITKKSLLSNAFSTRGKSPASQTRIPLGPAQAQHFVTNSRRRRQANELILETLEARRRALALNRQNAASLFGSTSYLEGVGINGGATAGSGGGGRLIHTANLTTATPLDPSATLIPASSDDCNTRLSLSPSPIGKRGANFSPSAQLRHRAPMSDLGGRLKNNRSPPSKTREQRLNAGDYKKRSNESLKSKSPPAAPRRPPLAKLDQNSSDLYSSNSSSSDSSESSGSQFTQLVTSELTPDCILLDEQALRQERQERLLAQDNHSKPVTSIQRPTSASKHPRESFKRLSSISIERSSPLENNMKPPKVPERTKRRQKHSGSPGSVQESAIERKTTESDLEGSSRLRRGALRRDSIRRLRLTRAPSQQNQQQSEADSSSDVASSSNKLNNDRKPLSPTRKLDIESNPFLNRGHFRTNSVRTSLSTTSENQMPDLSKDSRQKRNSWLFGSIKSNKLGEIESSEKPRMFSEVRRSNSSDHLATNKASKLNQIPAQQKEEIRQVERMLRQMKPNQVFTNHTRDETNQISSMQSRNAPNNSRMRAKSSELPPASATSYVKTKPTVTSGRSYDNLTPTEMVREPFSSKLNDSNETNRRQYELEEVKQFEISSSRLQCSSLGNEKVRGENMKTSHRTEIERSSSISPPVEFADHPKQARTTPSYPQRYQYNEKEANKEPARNSIEQRVVRSRPPISQHQPSQQAVPATTVLRRALSEERPAVIARRKVPLLNQSLKSQQEPNSVAPAIKLIHPQVNTISKPQLQPSLPKFERTADDEFKKRVDYLRKLAHANLKDEPIVGSKLVQHETPDKPLTKPMSTNWCRPNSIQDHNNKIESLPSSNKRSSEYPVSDKVKEQNVAMTNIDSLLVDNYQIPLSGSTPYSGFKWRRSNSSLASLPTSRSKLAEQPIQSSSSVNEKKQQQKLNYHEEGAQSVLSYSQQYTPLSKARELTSLAVVKLVVKEKSAPKLDYAHVEQQLNTQQQVESHTQQTRPNQQVSGPKQASHFNSTCKRPMLRVASPKSPDFGAAATSSNDDSAIASSVSSPSLSFMMNQPNNEQTKPALHASPAKPSIVPRVRSANLPVVQRVDDSTMGNAVVLQGILRRQQQQQQLDANMDGSNVTRKQQQVVENLEPTVKRAQIEQPREGLSFQSNTRIQTPEGSSGREANELAREDEQEEQAIAGSGIRRVHFNDKTSIRSFESISSLASNSTAVPNEPLRQQVGSPDSMESGSTSRLSAESPDLRKTSGAAIYAVRGDPELELEHANNLMTIHQQVLQQRQPLQYVPRYLDHSQTMMQAKSSGPYLRMTAPPSISTATTSPQCSPRQQQQVSSPSSQIQYIVRPTSLTSTQIVPTRAVMNILPDQMPKLNLTMVVKPNIVAADDDDDSYALRLRQAATSRVFSYTSVGAPSGSPVITHHSPAHSSPVQQQSVTIASGQKKPQQQQPSQQQQQVHSKRHLDNLRNYQTEV